MDKLSAYLVLEPCSSTSWVISIGS